MTYLTWLFKRQSAGRIEDGDNIVVHALHVIDGYAQDTWLVGRDVTAATASKAFDTERMAIFMATYFRDGAEETAFLKGADWFSLLRKLQAIGPVAGNPPSA